MDVKDLAPCKPAAARFCGQSDTSSSMTNLLKCGATLASVSSRVGESCRQVLRRYGQLAWWLERTRHPAHYSGGSARAVVRQRQFDLSGRRKDTP